MLVATMSYTYIVAINFHCVVHVHAIGKQLHLVHSQASEGAWELSIKSFPSPTSWLSVHVNHAVCVLAWNDEQSTQSCGGM